MNLYLFQPQYTTMVNGTLNAWLPYSVGTLWAFALQFPDVTDHFNLKEIIFRKEPIDRVLSRMEEPRVCGFSCYLWNRKYCLEMAGHIKTKWPDCVIIFGGPEVNGKMISYDFIDCIVMGEGEENFVDILKNIRDGRDVNQFMPKQRLQNLDIPNPYVTGVFESLFQQHPDLAWAMTLETNRGCPYSCTFCDWGSLTYSKVKKFEIDRIREELCWARDRPISYIYVADANFGIFKERDVIIAQMLREFTDGSNVDLISVQNAKQSTEVAFEIGKILGPKYAGVAIAMQSMNDDTLSAIKRKNLDINNISKLMALSEQYQVPTYTEMILGMPNETLDSWKQGLADLLEAGQHNSIEVWFTQMLENSEINQPDYRRKYGITTFRSTNYISIRGPDDDQEIDEETELISSTNTMTKEDIVQAYVFGWLIIQFHIAGYSQIVSRYLNRARGISYLDFYDHIYRSLNIDPDMAIQLEKLETMTRDFINTGLVPPGISGHMLHASTGPWLYQNRDAVMEFIFSRAKQIADLPDWVQQLQKSFIFDNQSPAIKEIQGDLDFRSGSTGKFKYSVRPQLKKFESGMTYALLRRRGLLKNIIEIEQIAH